MKKVLLTVLVLLGGLTLSACATQRNQAPTITGADLNPVIDQGDAYNPLTGVTADDPEDGVITRSIVVSGFEADDINYAGTYTITLTVTDSAELSTSVTITLTVQSASNVQPPVLSGVVAAQTYYVGSGAYDPAVGITAVDPVDGNITDDIEITGIVSDPNVRF
jgi:hypothetical protein